MEKICTNLKAIWIVFIFSNLIEEGIEEVELFMYEDIFKLLLTNKLSF